MLGSFLPPAHPLPYHPLHPFPLPPTPSIPGRNYFAFISNLVEAAQEFLKCCFNLEKILLGTVLRTGGVAQVVKCLSGKCEALSSIPATGKKRKERTFQG
jgi:hypothetical protein